MVIVSGAERVTHASPECDVRSLCLNTSMPTAVTPRMSAKALPKVARYFRFAMAALEASEPDFITLLIICSSWLFFSITC